LCPGIRHLVFREREGKNKGKERTHERKVRTERTRGRKEGRTDGRKGRKEGRKQRLEWMVCYWISTCGMGRWREEQSKGRKVDTVVHNEGWDTLLLDIN
jgi:hypothetical protein